jgi:hypothetical protein
MFKEMKVRGIALDPFTNVPIVILKDENDNTLPIWIGILEASAIATELEKIQFPRPMTHDLMKSILDKLNVKILKIEVTDLKNNTFYALIHLLKDDRHYEIDARPSDALALALRTNSPIFVEDSVIEKSKRIDLSKDKEDGKESDKWKELLENLSPEDFGKYKM